MIHSAKKAKALGLKDFSIPFDFAQIMERVQAVIKKIEPHDSIDRYQSLGVDCFLGPAKILSPWEVEIQGKILTTRNITLATGGSPLIPPLKGIDKIPYLTTETLWSLRHLPQKLIILGGGPVGLELAQCFARFGSEVSVVEQANRILSKEDPDTSCFLHQKLQQEKIHFYLNHQAEELYQCGDQKFLRCTRKTEGVETTPQSFIDLPFDDIIFAIGKKANTQNLGLENLSLSLRDNQTLEVNEFLQTKYPNIFACGDVTGPFQLTHMAAHQAWYCAVNGLFGSFKKFRVDYRLVPWCLYTDPEVASVGLNEVRAQELKIPFELTLYPLNDLDRAIADAEAEGFIKILTVPGKDKILGATIVGPQAGNLIGEFITAMKFNLGLNKILNTIHIYPTLGEANRLAAGVWKRKQTSPRLLSLLKKFHSWKRR